MSTTTSSSSPQKCLHKGCGKIFVKPDESPCVYHPGPPEFHEGQKGWMCCKPRVLTFDEFLTIPPCTTGEHSAVDDTPKEKPKPKLKEDDIPVRKVKPISQESAVLGGNQGGSLAAATQAVPPTSRSTTPQPPVLEEDSDPEDLPLPPANKSCKRKACGKEYSDSIKREDEECTYHPGAPLFHEGSKGWTCCKRKVLEFDEFLKIQGCKTRRKHCYVGKKEEKRKAAGSANGGVGKEEVLEEVRNDYYQTNTTVIVSFFLKKIRKEDAKVAFLEDGEAGTGAVDLDLPTSDGKRFTKKVDFWGKIDADKSQFKILGTKLELTVVKKAGEEGGWPVLRRGDRDTGERIQIGRAGRA